MCRIAAYLGPPISLEQLLLQPAHSLYRQSWEPRELRYAKLNADGHGFAWLGLDGRPGTYTSDLAIWNDHNLPALARSLHSGAWLANVRSATAGNPLHAINAQPFADDALLFTHNGYLGDFHPAQRRALLGQLTDAAFSELRGTTDSEHLFALIRSQTGSDLGTRTRQALQALDPGAESLLNVAITDGASLVVARHALQGECPSLYATDSHPDFAGGWLVASERFDDHPGWTAVPPHTLLILRPGQPAESTPLCD